MKTYKSSKYYGEDDTFLVRKYRMCEVVWEGKNGADKICFPVDKVSTKNEKGIMLSWYVSGSIEM